MRIIDFGRALAMTPVALICLTTASAQSARAGVGVCSAERIQRTSSALTAADTSKLFDALDVAAGKLARQGCWELALERWRAALQLRPREFTALHNSGLMLEYVGRYRESLEAFLSAASVTSDLHGKQTSTWHAGVAYYNLDRFSEALDAFRRAARMDTTDVSAFAFAAVSAYRLDQFGTALQLWNNVLRLDPHYFAGAQPGERAFYEESKRRVQAAP